MVAGTATLFLILSTLITRIFKLNNTISFFIKSILEMTMGLSTLSQINLNDIYKVVLSTIIISFGGLSVHMQVISSLEGSNIKYKNYIKGRIYQTIISAVLSLLIMILIK